MDGEPWGSLGEVDVGEEGRGGRFLHKRGRESREGLLFCDTNTYSLSVSAVSEGQMFRKRDLQ